MNIKDSQSQEELSLAIGISDVIAQFISEMLGEEGRAEFTRGGVAARFNCVPSQINYVLSTRFSPERGYVVESRRGGGGYIRVSRVAVSPERIVMHTVNAVGGSVDARTAAALIGNLLHTGAITEKAAKVVLAATSGAALRSVPDDARDEVRACIIKQILVNIL